MPTDTQIVNSQTSGAPSDYVLPASVELILKAVNADFDGSGAAAFLPCVEIISDSNHVIARAVDTAVSVAAGGSANASFFPGVKHAPAAATPTATALPWATSRGTITLRSTANSSADSVQGSCVTNDSTYFDLFADELRVKKAGLYLVSGFVLSPSSTITAGTPYSMTVEMDTFGVASTKFLVGGIPSSVAIAATSTGNRIVNMSAYYLMNIRTADLNVGLFTHVVTWLAAGTGPVSSSSLGVVRIADEFAGSIT